nr:hypothetical protein [Tanacetum cinerariifolium]
MYFHIVALHPFNYCTVWDNLPSDVLANVFSYLPPCSLARAMAACHHWHDCGRETRQICCHHQPWFIALPTRSTSRQLCFVHDPIQRSWHLLNLEHVPNLTRPLLTIGGQGLILFKSTEGVPIRLSVCNPFTAQFSYLPHLQKPRANPAVGVAEGCTNQFKLYVAGGMSEAVSGGAASYESTLEMFDSKSNKWTVMGPMPVEDKWKELGDTLKFATLIPHDGKVAVVGGTHDGNVLVWELGAGDEWILIERMPLELAKRFAGSSTKCAGIEGEVCLYKDIASRMVTAVEKCSMNLEIFMAINKKNCWKLKRFLRDTDRAIIHLHDHGIVHGRIRPQNILVKEYTTIHEEVPKLGEMSGCKEVKAYSTKLDKEPFSQDIYDMGRTILGSFGTHKFPDDDAQAESIYKSREQFTDDRFSDVLDVDQQLWDLVRPSQHDIVGIGWDRAFNSTWFDTKALWNAPTAFEKHILTKFPGLFPVLRGAAVKRKHLTFHIFLRSAY